MKIGFIGLGIMGRPMALNLHNAQHSLVVHDRASLADDIRAAAEVVGDGKTVAEKSEVVILMVPDTPDVDNVLFSPNGVAAGLSPGKLVIDMSSISPIETKAFAKKINALGCDYLDAPVSGGEVGAKQATLTIMVGGPGGCLRARQAAVRSDGQEHHPCRFRERRRPDLQGGEPDHRRAEHPGLRGSSCIRGKGRRRSSEGAAGADGRLCLLAHLGGACRAYAERHVQSRLPHPAAPEGPEPRAVSSEGTQPVLAQHGHRAADVLILCRAWWG